MNFFIRASSLLPYLILEVVEPVGQNETKKFYERLQNSVITFNMEEFDSCMPIIQQEECHLCQIETCNDCNEKFVIVYKWKNGDTDKKGVFKGSFDITFNDTNETLIVPIKRDLIIKII